MTEEQIQQLIDYLRMLGEAAVDKGFALAMLEVKVRIIQNAIGAVVGLALFPLGIWTWKKHQQDKYGMWDLWTFFSMLAGAIVFLVTALSLVGYALNPEWRAIRIVLSAISGN